MSKKTKAKKTAEELLAESLVEQPNQIPENWVNVRLGAIANSIKGKKPKKIINEKTEGSIPYITISSFNNVENNKFVLNNDVKVKSTKDDVLMVWDGARSGFVGRGVEGAVGSTLAKISIKASRADYLFYFLKSKYEYINKNHRGTGIPHVNPDILWDIPYPLPPMQEQKRIVDKMEFLLNKVDQAKQLIEEAKETFDLRRAAIMDKAFRGELTVKWREENPNVANADVIIAKIMGKRKEKPLEKKNEEIKDVPYKLPNGWKWARIGDIFHVQIGSTPRRNREEYWDGEYPWVSSGEVQFNEINHSREMVTEVAIKESRLKLVPSGSILFAMIGEGKTRGQVAKLNINAYHNQNVASIWVSETPINNSFVYYWLLSQYLHNRQNSSGNNQPAYNKARVQALLIPIPPLEEQEVISNILTGIIEKNNEALIKIDVENKINELKQSIMSQAFNGKLGTNDPTEENAIELLKEVLQEQVK